MAECFTPRIVIVGAGMAGLSAAHRLVTSGLRNVTLLEAADRIGGRIHTVKFGEGEMPVELGASWIHGSGSKNSTFQLAQSIGALVPYRIWNRMSGRFLREDGTEIDREIVTYGWNCFQSMMEEAQRILANGTSSGGRKNLGTTLKDMITRELGRSRYTGEKYIDLTRVFNAFCNYSAVNEGDDIEKVSCEFPDNDCVLPGGDLHVPAGYITLLKHLGKFLPQGSVKFQTEVVNIQWLNKAGVVTITTRSGSMIEADHVIVTCSLGVLKACHVTLFAPSLPVDKVNAIDSIGFGCVNKILLEYEKSVLDPSTQNVIFSWDDISVGKMETDWVKSIMGFDKIYAKQNVLLGWVSGDAAIYMETLSDEEIALTCTRLLRKFLGDQNFPEPRRILVSRWKSNAFIRGSYSYQKPDLIPGEQDTLSMPLTTPSGQPVVLFAGEATHQQYYSCTHGARDSGIRTADALLKLYSHKLAGSKY